MIEYLKEENRVLREQLGGRRILLTAAQRRRLALAGAKLGRELLEQVCGLFSPETILKWHRRLVALKYDSFGSGRSGGQAKKAREIRDLVIRMASENPTWGYARIHGELKALGFVVSRGTVRKVMRAHGFGGEPWGGRRMSWKLFLSSHFESIAACDFFTVEAWTKSGLTRFFVFFVIDIASRRVNIAGIEKHPHEGWMVQKARNLTDADCGFLKGKKYLIHDRDALFSRAFRATLRSGGIKCIRTPKRSPNLNDYASSCTSLAA